MGRISKENYYLDIAETVIGRATCLRILLFYFLLKTFH